MHRDVNSAAAVLGLKPSVLRKKLRELGVISNNNELQCKFRGSPYFFTDTRQRWNEYIQAYSYYGVIMVTEKGIAWIAKKMIINIKKNEAA
ncbi:hypothetical protein VQ643_09615 [Pseudomonas sp. F1_0610]|uniref:hypothetical protein n=1 Tax=Pseudomonas sp. F1_0610 TaxID=3114284 RepID=UPI0039C09CBB